MLKTLYLGKLFGIRIYIHWTFWLLVIFLFFGQIGNGFGEAIRSIGFVFAVFACVFLHELGHAFAGWRFGVRTHDISLLPIGGLARMEQIPERPLPEFVIAAAGPMVNVVIAAILFVGIGIRTTVEQTGTLMRLGPLEQLLIANIGLVLFNLLPVFPMDGGRILRAALSAVVDRSKAVLWTARLGQVLALTLAIWGLWNWEWMVALIFTIMFFTCSVELFQAKVRQSLAEALRQNRGTSPWGTDSTDFPRQDGEVIDAEGVRRVL